MWFSHSLFCLLLGGVVAFLRKCFLRVFRHRVRFSVLSLTENTQSNPSSTGEIHLRWMKSLSRWNPASQGYMTDGFDFIQDLSLDFIWTKWRFHRCYATISLNKQKKRGHFGHQTDLFSLSVRCMGLGLAANAFDQSNAILTLSGVVQILRYEHQPFSVLLFLFLFNYWWYVSKCNYVCLSVCHSNLN